MEDCKQIQDLLPFYLDDDVLTEAERRMVDSHIAHCASCRKELQDMQQNASLLHLMGRSIFQAPPELSLQVMEQLRSERPVSILSEAAAVRKTEKRKTAASFHPRRWVSGIAAAALLAVSVAGGLSSLPSDAPNSQIQVAQEGSEKKAPATYASPSASEAPPLDQQDTTESKPVVDGPISADTPTENIAPVNEESSEVASSAGTESEVPIVKNSSPGEEVSSNLVLLNQSDQVRSTLLKMSFTDVEAAVLQLQTTVADCGGKIINTTVSSDSNCEIFSIQVPREKADNLIVSITSSGFVLSQEQDFKTSLYSQLMEEYLQLQAQLSSSASSEEISVQLKTQLAEVEQKMQSAQQDTQYESVVVWVQLAE